jgi:hypothetical protein
VEPALGREEALVLYRGNGSHRRGYQLVSHEGLGLSRPPL